MNSVISAATIEARNSGWDVLGIMDGFTHLIEGRTDQVRSLSITDVSRIHVQGGSILRTARANPTVRDESAADPDWRLHTSLESLRKLGIAALVTIGGDDTAFSASRLAAAAGSVTAGSTAIFVTEMSPFACRMWSSGAILCAAMAARISGRFSRALVIASAGRMSVPVSISRMVRFQ